MRFLTTNLAKTATLSSTNESTNYPASNLAHQFLRFRWQPYGSGENTVTALWSEDQTIDVVFLGYISSVITNIDLKFYDSSDVLLETLSAIDTSLGNGAYYLSQQRTNVRYMEIVATGASGYYIGGLGVGEYFQPNRQTSSHPFGNDDRSVVSATPWGNRLVNRIPALATTEFSWEGQLRSDWDTFLENVLDPVGIGGTLWIDYYELDHSIKTPDYASLEDLSDSENDGYRYSWSVRLKEAR